MIANPCLRQFLNVLALLSAALLLACGSRGQEGTELSGEAAAKVDPELRRATSQLLAEGHGDSSLAVLVRVVEVVGGDPRAGLEAAGMTVDTVTGEVATGRVLARSIANVAALESVTRVEPSRQQKTY